MDINSYTGKRYGFFSYNCWQHVIAVRKDAGVNVEIDINSLSKSNIVHHDWGSLASFRNNHGLILLMSQNKARNFDIMIFKRPISDVNYYHAGIWFNGWISHSCNTVGQVIFEPLRQVMANRKGFEIWR